MKKKRGELFWHPDNVKFRYIKKKRERVKTERATGVPKLSYSDLVNIGYILKCRSYENNVKQLLKKLKKNVHNCPVVCTIKRQLGAQNFTR